MTTPVHVADGALHVGDKVMPLLSGEIQFWRMDPASWRPALEAAKRAGFTVVATYLSWRRHEPTPGAVEWGGAEPRLNARAFVQHCADLGLAVHLKPGPWICAEEPGGGYPDWLLADDEVVGRDAWGEPIVGYNPPFLHPVPCYQHPGYRAAARSWFAAVWDELGDLCYPAGPIVAVQLDNEPSHCFSHSLYYADYHRLSVDAFRRWLTDRYRDDRTLSEAWRVDVQLGAAEPPRPEDQGGLLSEDGSLDRRLADWAEFCGSAITEHLEFLRRQHAEQGAGSLLPTVNIINPPVFETPLSHTAVRAGTGASTGVDHYYLPPLDLTDIDRLAKTAAFARLAGEPLVWAPELMAGIWRSPGERGSYPDPTADEQAAWWGAALALGYQGFNLYMLADRENWQYAPIGDDLSSAPFRDAAARLVSLLTAHPDLLRARPVPAARLAWHSPDAVAAWCVTGTARGGEPVHTDSEPRRGYDSWDRAAFELLRAGVPYDLVDTATAQPAPLKGSILLVAADTSVHDAQLASCGWQVHRVRPDAGVGDLISAGVLRPPVRLTRTTGRCLAAVTRSNTTSYIHLLNWGEPCEAALTLDQGWPPDGWANLTKHGEPVDLGGLVLDAGHTVLSRDHA